MKSFVVKEKCNLKQFTDFVYPQGAFCLAALLRGKDIKVNGARIGKNVTLNAGDEVTYYTSPRQEQMPSHTVVYEDENVLIADKFQGVTAEGLCAELCALGEFYPVHRLDRNTGGLIAFAKNKTAEAQLLEAFKERKVNKIYLAVCKNAFKNKTGTLTAYLVKNEAESRVKVFSSPKSGGARIITEYEVLSERGDTALVKITLHTGKTHQIRAHMAYIGCPVVGDGKYGDDALNKKYSAGRQRLIAKYLTFNLDGGLSYLNGKEFKSNLDPDCPR
ncbi:MAG TPA: hypothetical protein DD415_06785 [Clostridiales bacterium]|nr:hypothetical protein [Clostridiales bacterium]